MPTLDTLALIIIYYVSVLLLCYLYTNSRFYKEERVFINYELDNQNNITQNNTKKMT
jgi:hypothetical protein